MSMSSDIFTHLLSRGASVVARAIIVETLRIQDERRADADAAAAQAEADADAAKASAKARAREIIVDALASRPDGVEMSMLLSCLPGEKLEKRRALAELEMTGIVVRSRDPSVRGSGTVVRLLNAAP